jgi:predicted nucleic acid-binding Zn ribbon protein
VIGCNKQLGPSSDPEAQAALNYSGLNTMKRMQRKAKFVHIGHVLEDVLKNYRRETNTDLVRVWHVWDGVMGEVIAQNARPAAFKGRLLLVHVTSSTWIHQLQFLKYEMVAKLNDALGKNLIEDLKFKIGPLGEDN